MFVRFFYFYFFVATFSLKMAIRKFAEYNCYNYITLTSSFAGVLLKGKQLLNQTEYHCKY